MFESQHSGPSHPSPSSYPQSPGANGSYPRPAPWPAGHPGRWYEPTPALSPTLQVVLSALVVPAVVAAAWIASLLRNERTDVDTLAVLRGLPYAVAIVAVLLLGRTLARRMVAATVLIGAGLLEVGPGWVLVKTRMAFDLGPDTFRVTIMVTGVAASALAVAAWGIARRRGYLWVIGVVVTVGTAAYARHHLIYEVDHYSWWTTAVNWLWPVVVGCLLAWMFEAIGRGTGTVPASRPGMTR